MKKLEYVKDFLASVVALFDFIKSIKEDGYQKEDLEKLGDKLYEIWTD